MYSNHINLSKEETSGAFLKLIKIFVTPKDDYNFLSSNHIMFFIAINNTTILWTTAIVLYSKT